jgi:hypothetical protein
MRLLTVLVLIVAGLSGCVGCPPVGVATAKIDAGDHGNEPVLSPIDATANDAPLMMSDCQTICINLYNADCAEATRFGQPFCVDTCEHILKSKFLDLDVKCLLKAETTFAVKMCGIRCPR